MDQLISAQELYEQLQGDTPPTVIDVRGEEAFAAAHIPGAIHIPRADLLASLDRIPKDRPVVTY